MLTKIIFTLLVIVIVALVFRNKHGGKPAPKKIESADQGSLSTRTVAYCILAVLIVISITVFVMKYKSDNRIINITVIADDGASTVYQARQKSIKGRQFVTLGGTQVTLGESDRIEKDEK